jgi:phage gpG-like protein
MPAELRLRIEAGPEVMAVLAARAEAVNAASRRALSDSLQLVHRKITLNLTGRVLRVQTGRLRQSLQTFMSVDGTRGTIGTNVEYAAIHEFGGVTRPHSILVATRKGRLSSTARAGKNLKTFGFRIIDHPGATIPARPYMRPALEDSRDDISELFVTRILRALKGKA